MGVRDWSWLVVAGRRKKEIPTRKFYFINQPSKKY